jgi:hypothetical protein
LNGSWLNGEDAQAFPQPDESFSCLPGQSYSSRRHQDITTFTSFVALNSAPHSRADDPTAFEASEGDVHRGGRHLPTGTTFQLGQDGGGVRILPEPKRSEQDVMLEFAQNVLVTHGYS